MRCVQPFVLGDHDLDDNSSGKLTSSLSRRVTKLSLQFHSSIGRPFSTVELRFTVTLDHAKSLSPLALAFHVVCTVIISIKSIISNHAIFCIFISVNENCGSVGPEKQ